MTVIGGARALGAFAIGLALGGWGEAQAAPTVMPPTATTSTVATPPASSPPTVTPTATPTPVVAFGACAGDPVVAPGRLPGSAGSKVTFAIKFQDEVSPHRLISAFVMPGTRLDLEAVLTDREGVFAARADAGRLERLAAERWRWHAPATPGAYRIVVADVRAGEIMCIRAFVLRPYDGGEHLNGYRIGNYERLPLNDDPGYAVPSGFVEVTPGNQDAWVSPHFQLWQFLCKQDDPPPRYVALRTRLLLKLEALLEHVNREGIAAETFTVMSGYRTPYYNARIGNRTSYSRHAYGDAADIYVDRDGDGQMDDLDGDGAITVADAGVLFDLIDGLHGLSWYMPFVGGLGLYAPTAAHGPFVHVDTRGRRARW